ncbi:MAG: hypothetical protein IPM60_15400 [Rhodospirillales bacterium]|nr:hypothetical protein [Rhodospirillales bacterium]
MNTAEYEVPSARLERRDSFAVGAGRAGLVKRQQAPLPPVAERSVFQTVSASPVST